MHGPLDTGFNIPPTSSGGPPIRNLGNRDRHSAKPRKNEYNGATAEFFNNNWQPANSLDLGLRPRSFEEIDSERTQHIDKLQKQDSRTLDLLGRLAGAEDYISRSQKSNNGRGELKKMRKHRGWLKRQIKKSINEERSVMMELGELHIEIQCRERWFQVQKDQEFRDTGYHPPTYGVFPPLPSPSPTQTPFFPPGALMPTVAAVATHPPWSVNHHLQMMPFGVVCPCGCNGTWHQVNPSFAPGFSYESYPGPPSFVQTENGANNPPIQETPFEVDQQPDAGGLGGTPDRQLGTRYHARKGRRSLPSLRFVWADETEKIGEPHICLGYDTSGLGGEG